MWGETGCLGHLDLRSRSVLSAERSEVTGECRELWPRQGGSRDTSRMQPALPAGTVTALSPDVPWSGPPPLLQSLQSIWVQGKFARLGEGLKLSRAEACPGEAFGLLHGAW